MQASYDAGQLVRFFGRSLRLRKAVIGAAGIRVNKAFIKPVEQIEGFKKDGYTIVRYLKIFFKQ